MEAECHVREPDVVIDRLGQADDVEAFLREEVGGLVRAVAAQTYQAIQAHALIVFLHGLDLVHLVVADDAHVAVGRALGAQDRAAQRENAGKLFALHPAEIAVDQAGIAVLNADDFGIKHAVGCARYAADGRVQAGAVSARGQNADTSFHIFILLHY